MTKPADKERCEWCGAVFRIAAGPGRPSRYCKRSHRQRAYEARRLASDRGLAVDEVLVKRSTWTEVQDSVYTIEAAIEDAVNDLTEATSEAELRSIVSHLIDVSRQLADVDLEPRAVGNQR